MARGDVRYAPGFPALILGDRRRPAGGAGIWICHLNRDVDIIWPSIEDATDGDVTCTFHELPGASWTARQASSLSRSIKRVLDKIP